VASSLFVYFLLAMTYSCFNVPQILLSVLLVVLPIAFGLFILMSFSLASFHLFFLALFSKSIRFFVIFEEPSGVECFYGPFPCTSFRGMTDLLFPCEDAISGSLPF